jgi:hypothetical protein
MISPDELDAMLARGATAEKIVNAVKASIATELKKREATRLKDDAEFEEFWQAYPERDGPNFKPAARRAWEKTRHRIGSHRRLMAAVKAYARLRCSQDPKYTLTAATWLYRGGWEKLLLGADETRKPKRQDTHSYRVWDMLVDHFCRLEIWMPMNGPDPL